MDNAAIGVVDSGWGGLSIWQSLTKLLPHESLIYIGDHAHLPYSEKSPSFIQRRVRAILRHLISRRVKCIVIACNTATVAGIRQYRKQFPLVPIVGVVPVVKVAALLTKTKRFAVFSTSFTAQSRYQKELIKRYASFATVSVVSSPTLVALVETGQLSGKKVTDELSRILTPILTRGVDVIALGCTHYTFLRSAIRAIVGDGVRVVDPSDAVARRAGEVLSQHSVARHEGKPTYEFYTTGNVTRTSRVATSLIGQKVTVSYVSI